MADMQLLHEPSCHVALQDYLGQPDDDYDRRYNTVLLTFRVSLTGPLPTTYDEVAVYYRRKYSEPLSLMTHQRHSDLARDKLSRMLQAVRVPTLSCSIDYNFDIVGYILDEVRSIASGLEDPLRALRLAVTINAVLLYRPDLSESDRYKYEDGPPIYLDGPNSRNYEDYSEDEEEEEDEVEEDKEEEDEDDTEDIDVHDDRVSCEMRVELIDSSHASYEDVPHRNFLISINAWFTPEDNNGYWNIRRNFSEDLHIMIEPRCVGLARHALFTMLNHVQVPQPHSDIVIAKILRGIGRHRHDILDNPWSVMRVEVDLNLLVRRLPSLWMQNIRDASQIHYNSSTVDYMSSMDFQIEPRFVAASADAIGALEKVSVVEPLSCSICLEDVATGSEVTRLPCSHDFHGDCIVKWLKTSKVCPLCRLELNT